MKVACSVCGKEFERDNRTINLYKKQGLKHYCSSACKSNKIECKCAKCGVSIFKTPYELSRSKSGNTFCSKSCACSYNNTVFRSADNNPNWKGGRYKTSVYAKKAFRNYEHICVVCGFDNKKALEVHHIDKDRGNDRLDNLIILCANCHCLVHYDNLKISQDIKDMRKYKK